MAVLVRERSQNTFSIKRVMENENEIPALIVLKIIRTCHPSLFFFYLFVRKRSGESLSFIP